MNDNLHPMPKLATENKQASPPRPITVRTYAELGTYARYIDMPEASASTTGGDAGEGGMVCPAGPEPIA